MHVYDLHRNYVVVRFVEIDGVLVGLLSAHVPICARNKDVYGLRDVGLIALIRWNDVRIVGDIAEERFHIVHLVFVVGFVLEKKN